MKFIEKDLFNKNIIIIDHPDIKQMANKIDDSKVIENMTIIGSPMLLLWDYFIYEYDNDDVKFCDFFNKHYNVIDFDYTKDNIFIIDEYFLTENQIVKDGDYINLTKDELFELKVMEQYPPFCVFFNNEMINKIEEHYKMKFNSFDNFNLIKIPNDFNSKDYKIINKNQYPEINNMNECELCLFFNNHKDTKYKLENIPIDFNAKAYMILNKELNLSNENEAFVHYNDYGFKENLKYKFTNLPKFFDVIAFKCFNQEFRKMLDEEVLLWVELNNDKIKNMKYMFEYVPFDFDIDCYMKQPDLNKAFKDNIYAYYLHYEKHGFLSGRKYKA
jgi:hypothetical protein